MIAGAVEQKGAHAAAMEEFEQAADALALSEDIRAVLRRPEEVRYDQVPVTTHEGNVQSVDAWRVRHSSSRGPAKGGVCIHPGASLDEIEAKAMFMTWKWAVLDIPLGGAMAGAAAGMNNLMPGEAERLSREISAGSGGAVADDGAPRGVFYTVQAACEHAGLALAGARVVIHGFGRTGSGVALLAARHGARVIGASDTRGAICRESGLNVEELLHHKSRIGSVVGIHHAEPITDCELLALDCDILIVSALEGAIRNRNAPTIRARMMVEAADGSITPAADAILEGKGVLVVPDILANAGRDALAYYELTGTPDPGGRLLVDLRAAFKSVWTMASDRKTTLRRAAFITGVSRVAEAIRHKSDPDS